MTKKVYGVRKMDWLAKKNKLIWKDRKSETIFTNEIITGLKQEVRWCKRW